MAVRAPNLGQPPYRAETFVPPPGYQPRFTEALPRPDWDRSSSVKPIAAAGMSARMTSRRFAPPSNSPRASPTDSVVPATSASSEPDWMARFASSTAWRVAWVASGRRETASEAAFPTLPATTFAVCAGPPFAEASPGSLPVVPPTFDVVLIGHSCRNGDGRPEEGARAVRAGESAPSQA